MTHSPDVCPICLDCLEMCPDTDNPLEYLQVVSTKCDHSFHRHCLVEWLQSGNLGQRCPYCKQPVQVTDLAPERETVFDRVNRLLAMIERLEKKQKRKQAGGIGNRSLRQLVSMPPLQFYRVRTLEEIGRSVEARNAWLLGHREF